MASSSLPRKPFAKYAESGHKPGRATVARVRCDDVKTKCVWLESRSTAVVSVDAAARHREAGVVDGDGAQRVRPLDLDRDLDALLRGRLVDLAEARGADGHGMSVEALDHGAGDRRLLCVIGAVEHLARLVDL